ncbi:MAG: HEAT repeat domain-containing protein [Methanothrix sp.]|nr:HEAT repeat domain-containing protein [Methanothrix sp.]
MATALGRSKSDCAIELMSSWLNDSDNNEGQLAIIALGNIGNDNAIELLVSRFADSNVSMRVIIVRALGRVGNDRAIEPLIARLCDIDGIIRSDAVEALSNNLDEIDKILLSCYLDGENPFLDPFKEIPFKFAARAADRLSIKVEDVISRYKALADRFHLRLAWCAQK